MPVLSMPLLDVPLYVWACAVSLVVSIPVLWRAVAAAEPIGRLVKENLDRGQPGPADIREARLKQSARDRLVAPAFGALGRLGRRFTPASVVTTLEQRLALAGMTGRWPVERMLAMKVIAATAGFLLGLATLVSKGSGLGLLAMAVFPTSGYVIPDVLMNQRARARQALIVRKLPDTLDEITISVEAGLGFEAAMAEAGRSGNGPLAEELIRTLQEIQVGVPRAQALNNLVFRTDVPDLKHFVLAVRQAEQYGVPTAQVLRVQSKEIRERRKQRAEERAMKMPVKILIPTVFFILPSLFIVILGPAVLRLADSLGR